MLRQDALASALAPACELFPADAAHMARADESQVRMLGVPPSVADTVTTGLMGAFNGRPTVRHRAGANREALDMIARSGVVVDEDMRLYETPDEADRHARQIIQEGFRLAWPYPPEPDRFPDDAQLIAPALWKQLNSKQRLHEIVPPRNLANRARHYLADMDMFELVEPVFLKAGGDTPTGSGFAVRRCETQAELEDALRFFRSLDDVRELIVEEAVDVTACWCVSLAIGEHSVRFVGASEQLFDAPARQSGNVVDPDNPMPQVGVDLALAVGEAARAAGFLGAGGMDIGVTAGGRAVVFDPNFRAQASTQLVLFHEAAAKRSGLPASRALQVMSALDPGDIERAARRPIDDGWFVATRLLDGALLPSIGGRAMVSGFVLGADRAQADLRHAQMEALLTG